jgi:prepilin-type N-terminal cleavage/methylation domain-containing protein
MPSFSTNLLNSSSSLRTRARRAFTLLELLIVIGIIVILASLVLAVSSTVIRASEDRATRNTIEVLNAAVEEYERTAERRITYKSGLGGGFAADPNAVAGYRYDVDGALAPSAAAPFPGSGPSAADLVTTWTVLASPYGSLVGGGLPSYSMSPFRRTAYLIALLSASPSSGAVISKLPESVFRYVGASTGNGKRMVRHAVDSWDTPIIAIFPGREAVGADVATPALTALVDKDGTIRSDSERAAPALGGLQVSCKDRRVLFVSAGNDSRFTNLTGSVYTPSTDNLYSYEPVTTP